MNGLPYTLRLHLYEAFTQLLSLVYDMDGAVRSLEAEGHI